MEEKIGNPQPDELTVTSLAKAIYNAFTELNMDFGNVRAAALAFYIMLSIIPLALLAAVLITNIFGAVALSEDFYTTLSNLIGEQYALVLTNLINSQYETASSGVWTWIGFLCLIYAASHMFYESRMSIDALWHLTPKSGMVHSILSMARTYALAYVTTLIVGISFLILLFVGPFINLLADSLMSMLRLELARMQSLLEFIISPVMFTFIFFIAFRFLPQANARKRDLLVGAFVTAILYWFGNFFYGIYLSFSTMDTFYGAAGNLILFMFWMYYSAYIFLYGAKFTYHYACKFGTGITPHQNMTTK